MYVHLDPSNVSIANSKKIIEQKTYEFHDFGLVRTDFFLMKKLSPWKLLVPELYQLFSWYVMLTFKKIQMQINLKRKLKFYKKEVSEHFFSFKIAAKLYAPYADFAY